MLEALTQQHAADCQLSLCSLHPALVSTLLDRATTAYQLESAWASIVLPSLCLSLALGLCSWGSGWGETAVSFDFPSALPEVGSRIQSGIELHWIQKEKQLGFQ